MAHRIIREGKPQSRHEIDGINRITVGGFKSIFPEQSIDIRPLTILAGANSSGKSSMMQPLLLLKQTLESTYDPGALLLNGPNVRFTQFDQLLSRKSGGNRANELYVGVELESDIALTTHFRQSKNKGKGFEVGETIHKFGKQQLRIYREMPSDEINDVLTTILAPFQTLFSDIEREQLIFQINYLREAGLNPIQYRCFLTLDLSSLGFLIPHQLMNNELNIGDQIRQMIHLPGLRGNPERNYPVTAVGYEFPGTFENYVASVIGQWQTDGNSNKLRKLNRDLKRIGLLRKVVAKPLDDTRVELLVNPYHQSNKDNPEDFVSIVDVGFGVSQALPVIVALHTANPGQFVYLEQPEIHLHPRAQFAMAEVLADAAKEGKRLVVETHSSLLLLGIQTLVAEGKLPPDLVKLHWFALLEDGSTQISSADLDETGAFGDWPEDFHTVTLNSESRYLDAAESRLLGE